MSDRPVNRDEVVPVLDDQAALVDRLLAKGYAQAIAEIEGIPVIALNVAGISTLLDLLCLLGATYRVAPTPEERVLSVVAADLVDKMRIALEVKRPGHE